MTIIDFVEHILGLELSCSQKTLLETMSKISKDYKEVKEND